MKSTTMIKAAALVCASLAVGCGEARTEDGVLPTVGDAGADGGDTGGISTSGADEDGDDEDTGERYDVGGGEPPVGGCNGDSDCELIDVLFVIDNSGSMADEQANLVASFPGFISAMQTELAETEGYNIGVVTSDEYIFDITCGGLDIGYFVQRTGGPDSSDQICGPYTGGAYMTEADNLDDKFSCAAQVGTGGDGDEHPMEAMLRALDPALQADDGCNAGFLRDDALLVVVVITDEEDDHETLETACDMTVQPGSPGEPQDWFDDLVALKGGEETNIVMLSLVGPDAEYGTMCPELDKCNDGVEGAEVAGRILEFIWMFTYGFIGPVCEDYGPIFQESIATIKTACDEFNPQG